MNFASGYTSPRAKSWSAYRGVLFTTLALRSRRAWSAKSLSHMSRSAGMAGRPPFRSAMKSRVHSITRSFPKRM